MQHPCRVLSVLVGFGLALCLCGLGGAQEASTGEDHSHVERSTALAESVSFLGADAVHLVGYTGYGTTIALIGEMGVDNTLEGLDDGDVLAGFTVDWNTVTPGIQGTSGDHHDDMGAYIITAYGGGGAPIGVASNAKILPFWSKNGKLMEVHNAMKTILSGKIFSRSNPGNPAFQQYLTLRVISIVQADPDALQDVCNCDNDFWGKKFERTASKLAKEHVVTFAGSGNDGECDRVSAPACVSSIEAVAAVYDGDYGGPIFHPSGGCSDPAGVPHLPTCFSNRVGQPCNGLLGAPGYDISTPHGTDTGTSFATPHVAGVAALILEKLGCQEDVGVPGIMRATAFHFDHVWDWCADSDAVYSINAWDAILAISASCLLWGHPTCSVDVITIVDLQLFFIYMLGPALQVPPGRASCCDFPDSPPDGDVDLHDFAKFQLAYCGTAKGACCYGDTSCADVEQSECDATGGAFQGIFIPCSDVVCPAWGACCFNDGYCEVMTEGECTGNNCEPGENCPQNTFGAEYIGDATSCDDVPYPCPGDPPGGGACCLEDGSCLDNQAAAECALIGGDYKGDDTVCSNMNCAQPQTGACCLPDETCVDNLSVIDCLDLGGSLHFPPATCSPSPCGPTGACCMPNGDCAADHTTAECGAIGGTYWGNATLCDPNPCPEPTGACCMRDDTCQEPLTAADCGVAGGSYLGDFSTCGALNCRVTGACCLPAANCETDCVGLCDVLTASACGYQGGGYAGDAAKCASTDCSDCNDGPTVFGTCQTDERRQVVADDAAVSAKFGYAVSLSGDMALVGAPGDESFGSAYVIRLGCGGGQTKLRESDPRSGENFGKAVAMSGDTAVVLDPPTDFLGPPGVACVFQKPPLGWGDSMVETARLMISDPDATLGPPESVAINETEDIILFGHPYDCEGTCPCLTYGFDQGCGSVYVYHRPALGWGNHEEDFILTADDFDAPPAAGKDRFGHAVSISGLVALVGAPGDYVSVGSAYIFRFDGTNWIEEAKLIACDPAAVDQFGTSVSISGDVAVVGAPYDNDAGSWSGSAYVFRFDPQTELWHQEAKLTASDGAFNDRFGFSVSISGDLAVIGAYLEEDTETNSGSMYVFRFDGFNWNEEAKLTASDASLSDEFGTSVSVAGDRAVAGAPVGEAKPGTNNSGAAYVFEGLGDCDDSQTTDLCQLINDPALDCCPPHDCCETSFDPGCSDAGIMQCVCEQLGTCCTAAWTAECVALVEGGTPVCGVCDPGGNGIIDTCEDCPADFDGDGDVDPFDLAELLGAWGDCPPQGGCQEDLSGDCEVGAFDLAILLGCWGLCPCYGEEAQWNGGPDGSGALRFALGGGPGCLSLEEVVQMMGYADIAEFIEWVLSEVPPEWVYQVAQFVLWLLENWPC